MRKLKLISIMGLAVLLMGCGKEVETATTSEEVTTEEITVEATTTEELTEESNEEKVEGATIIHEEYCDTKVFDEPKIIVDNDDVCIKITKLFMSHDENGTVDACGIKYITENKSDERYAWIFITDVSFGDYMAYLDYSSGFSGSVMPGKTSQECDSYTMEVENIDSFDVLEKLSGSVSVYMSTDPNGYGATKSIDSVIPFSIVEEE